MSTTVSGLSNNFFPSPQNGFSTTLASSISAGATSVPLNSVAGYANGEIAVLVVDPGNSSKQTFTGVVDTAGIQLTSVVWTAGTNVAHTSGATVTDYATATHIASISKGIKIAHNQDGTHKSGAVYTLPTVSDFTNATHTHTNAAGGGQLGTSALSAAAVTDAKLVYGKVRSRQGGSATDWSSAGTTTYDYSATNTFIQVGTKTLAAQTTSITFPTAFNQKPIVTGTGQGSAGVFSTGWYINNISTTGFDIICQDYTKMTPFMWVAVGE